MLRHKHRTPIRVGQQVPHHEARLEARGHVVQQLVEQAPGEGLGPRSLGLARMVGAGWGLAMGQWRGLDLRGGWGGLRRRLRALVELGLCLERGRETGGGMGMGTRLG